MNFKRYEKKVDIGDIVYVIVRAILMALLFTVIIMTMLGYEFMIVTSGSMTPTIPVGSLIVVQPCTYDELELGDIVTKKAGGFYVTHRVHGKSKGKDINGHEVMIDPTITDESGNVIANPEYERGYWVTKGDASDTIDGRLGPDTVVGKTIFCLNAVGVAYRFIVNNKIYTIVLIVLFAIMMMIASYLTEMFKVVDLEEDEDEE